jgi:putative addiction module component (TIGR02574 family)
MIDATGLSQAAESLLPALDTLTTKDRLELARRLLAEPEIAPEEQAAVQAAWESELVRRVEEIRSGKVVAVPIEEMFKKSREKHP